MKIDNSQYLAFQKCPLFWYERYVTKKQKPHTYFEFGKLFHEMLECGYKGITCDVDKLNAMMTVPDERLVAEAEAMYEAYKAHYPVEPFEVVDCEKSFALSIPGTKHTYAGRLDMTVRSSTTKHLQLFESKTEKRGSYRNHPKAWAARSQVSLYFWAAQQVYGEPVDNIILNVATRGSEKGQIGPTFRRDLLERTPQQQETALKDLVYVADQIETLLAKGEPFPSNRNACMEGNFPCDYYDLHNIGSSEDILAQFEEAEEYLTL